MLLLCASAVAALAIQTCPVLDSKGNFYLIAAWKVKCICMGGAMIGSACYMQPTIVSI